MSTKTRSILADEFNFRLQLNSVLNARATQHDCDMYFPWHRQFTALYPVGLIAPTKSRLTFQKIFGRPAVSMSDQPAIHRLLMRSLPRERTAAN
jgi:hypothetical protein